MLDDHERQPASPAQIFDAVIHVPTLLVIAIFCVALLWYVYGIGLDFGPEFIRVQSNQGNVTLFWTDGCCAVDWRR